MQTHDLNPSFKKMLRHENNNGKINDLYEIMLNIKK